MAKRPEEPKSSEITPENFYVDRRQFIKSAALYLGTSATLGGGLIALTGGLKAPKPPRSEISAEPLSIAPPSGSALSPSAYAIPDPKSSFEDITSYNNFYELGYGKEDPAELASG